MTKIDLAKEYQWSQNKYDPICHTDIKPVIEELDIIYETVGEITPKSVVDSAKNKKSSLHGYFQWDDTKAANSWRIKQAANLISLIQIKIVSDGKPKVIQAFSLNKQATPTSGGSSYTKTIDMIETQEGIDYILKFIITDLNRVKGKLSPFSTFTKAVEFIDKAILELSKESTETKEEVKPVLTVAV